MFFPDFQRYIRIGGGFLSFFFCELNMNPVGKKYTEIRLTDRNETHISGIFSAGNVTDFPKKQTVAVGEGVKSIPDGLENILHK